MDGKASIVMKLGAEKCDVGLSCDAAPRAAIRTLVGRPNVKVKTPNFSFKIQRVFFMTERQRRRPAAALRRRGGRVEGGTAECATTAASRQGGQLGRHGAALAARLQGRAQGRP